MSEYMERMQQARADLLGTVTETDKRIAAIYDRAAQELARQAAAQKDGSLTKRWQEDMSRSLDERMRQLNGDVTATVLASASAASQLPGTANADWLGLVLQRCGKTGSGDAFRSVMTRTSDEALRQVVNGAAYLDSKSLSRRIWQNNQRAREGINEVLRQGIAQKQSARELAKMLEQYVNPKAWENYDWRKIYPNMPSWLSGRWTSVEKHAQTVARTTINHAYHLAMVETAKQNPFAEAIHWALSPQHWDRQVRPFGMDICDEYSEHEEGLGVGNFPLDQVPLPHARCLCVQYAVVPKTLEQCAVELKDWLDGGSNPELEAAFGRWKAELGAGGSVQSPLTPTPVQAASQAASPASQPQGGQQPAQAQANPATDERTKLMEQIAQQPWAQKMNVADREAVNNVLGNSTIEELSFFAKNGDKIKGEFYAKDNKAYYHPLTQEVHLNIGKSDPRSVAAGYPMSDVRVFFHETGHLFDAQAFTGTQLRVELGNAYELAIRKDFTAHANKVLAAAGEPPIKSCKAAMSLQQKKVLAADLQQNPHVQNAVSDIASGLTNCRVMGWYGHTSSYWKTQTPGVEAVAHMFEATYLKGERLTTMQEYYPNAYKLFTDTITKLTGGGTP